MGTPKFQRRLEDFVCEHCGCSVTGDGYTNHCPTCLWSKHVDVNPGDRAEPCGGSMEPVALEGGPAEYKIVHHCIKCGIERKNIAAEGDEPDALVAIAQKRQMGNN